MYWMVYQNSVPCIIWCIIWCIILCSGFYRHQILWSVLRFLYSLWFCFHSTTHSSRPRGLGRLLNPRATTTTEFNSLLCLWNKAPWFQSVLAFYPWVIQYWKPAQRDSDVRAENLRLPKGTFLAASQVRSCRIVVAWTVLYWNSYHSKGDVTDVLIPAWKNFVTLKVK